MTSGGNERRDRDEPDVESADAFSLLGDETRLKILSVLHDPSTHTPLEFSELHDRIGTEFTSGFNYHLDKLVPTFVSKTDDGYALTSFGNRVARAIASGTFAGDRRIDPFPIDGTCVVCGERALRARYDDEQFPMKTFQIECRSCDELIITVSIPPNLVSKSDADDMADAVDHWMHNWLRMSVPLKRLGICDYCGGAIDVAVVDDVPDFDRFEVLVKSECVECGREVHSTVGALASQHPSVQRFHARRGESMRDRRYWEIEQWISDDPVAILSDDPWRFRVTFRADGDTCEVAVDDDLQVTDVSILADEH